MPITAAANAIISWAEYKASVPGISDDTDQDRYQMLINQASARIELHTRRKLKARDYTGTGALLLDAWGTSRLILPHRPINSVAHLYADSSRAFGPESEIPAGSYSIRPEGIIVLYSGSFPKGLDVIKAELNAGYPADSPEWAVLQSACLELVRWMDSRMQGFVGKRVETNADGMNIGYEIELPLNIRTMLEPFCEVAV